MNWKELWSQFATSSQDAMRQVGRTVNNNPISDNLINEIVKDIITKTQIAQTDKVLDICCGNGLLTQKIASHCKEIIGIDREEKLIERAKAEFKQDNITYLIGDALQIADIVDDKFDVIILYFSFQYFDSLEAGQKMISAMLSLLNPNGCILIGDVPDREKLAVFYPRWIDRFRYWITLMTGKNAMGKFWKYEEILQICEKYDAQVKLCPQKKELPYSHYRIDFLISYK